MLRLVFQNFPKIVNYHQIPTSFVNSNDAVICYASIFWNLKRQISNDSEKNIECLISPRMQYGMLLLVALSVTLSLGFRSFSFFQ